MSAAPRIAVVGAGPAGAIAAYVLARRGANVALYEKSSWPRAKACGDGLTPSSVALLDELGIALPARARFTATYVTGPTGAGFRAPWPSNVPDGTTFERSAFDALLVAAAIEAGARFFDRIEVAECRPDGTLTTRANGATATERFDAIALAEGGTGALAERAGLPPFAQRLGAYRGYVSTPADLPDEYGVHYARPFVPGYAWIFPVAPRRANVGAVLAAKGDVRALLRGWIASSPEARRALGPSPELESGRGGIIAIGRTRRNHERVFAIGDAAGIADPLSAEGVSQAMRSAVLFGDALTRAGGNIAKAGAAYEHDVRAFDANNREAFRMRALFAILAGPMTALAAKRPRLARHVIASGYFPKRDSRWFAQTFAALR
jgi:geranylgeranyl reductase family protein